MKETKKYFSKYYPPLRLYKDDIEDIISIFKKHFQDFEITVDKYELNDPLEIEQIKAQKTNQFYIKHHHHYEEEKPSRHELISLELKKDSAWLYLSNDSDTLLLGVATTIDRYLSKKIGVAGKLFSHRTAVIILAILIALFLTFYTVLPWKFSDHSTMSITLGIITVIPASLAVIWFLSYMLVVSKWSIIYLINRAKKDNFFRRNKDQIILTLTVGFITALVTGILTAIITSAIIQK